MSEIMQALYEGRRADVDGRQSSGHTALDEAKIREDQELIDLLRVRLKPTLGKVALLIPPRAA